MGLGLSIYPAKASEAEIVEYLELGKKYHYTWIFTSLLAIHEQNDDAGKLKRIIKKAQELGYKVQVDVSPDVFVNLGIEPTDLSYFAELGVNAIRLDEPFNGQVESIMSFNQYGIEIIINASSDVSYIDLILDYQANRKNIIACHNFYPQPFTGLERNYFNKTSQKFCDLGIKTAAFINANEAEICSSYSEDGVCTLEEHRNKSVIMQVRDLKYSRLIDDIYFANMFASENELKAVSDIYFKEEILTIDIEKMTELTKVETAIINELHMYRGDISEYMVRSTQTRLIYKDELMPLNNAKEQLKRGDIVILNDNFANYAKELHVVLSDFNVENNKYNVVGKVINEQLPLLEHLKPWTKFKLNLK